LFRVREIIELAERLSQLEAQVHDLHIETGLLMTAITKLEAVSRTSEESRSFRHQAYLIADAADAFETFVAERRLHKSDEHALGRNSIGETLRSALWNFEEALSGLVTRATGGEGPAPRPPHFAEASETGGLRWA
jgi:hypothetical protein